MKVKTRAVGTGRLRLLFGLHPSGAISDCALLGLKQAMEIFCINTDNYSGIRPFGLSYHDDWIRRGVAVAGGDPSYREQLSRVRRDDYVLIYANDMGVVGIGIAIDDKVRDVTGAETVEEGAAIEYHKAVDWQVDLRDAPITRTELKSLMGWTPVKALQRVVKDRERTLAWIQERLPGITNSSAEYLQRSGQPLRLGHLAKPIGIATPKKSECTVQDYYRDPRVRAWTLQRAAGHCELCDRAAPFHTGTEEPYLESHHIVTLADGGSDTPDNTAAICPNCHRELHLGIDRLAKGEHLRQLIAHKESTESRLV